MRSLLWQSTAKAIVLKAGSCCGAAHSGRHMTRMVCTIHAIYILATCSDSKYIELYSSTATVSLSPIAPLCLHAPPIDSSIDYICHDPI